VLQSVLKPPVRNEFGTEAPNFIYFSIITTEEIMKQVIPAGAIAVLANFAAATRLLTAWRLR
jgi:hypothetical protein